MAGYGCIRTFAKRLGFTGAQKRLQETVDEEAEADEKLSALAKAVVNPEALAEKTSGNGKKKAVRGSTA